MKGDVTASILVKAVLLMSAFLGTTVHVVHIPRKTTWENIVADKLSRRKTTTHAVRKLLNSFSTTKVPSFFRNWLSHPSEDWNLPRKCLDFVQTIV